MFVASAVFEPWPKIARLNRDIIVTEKIDGTNAAVLIINRNEIDNISDGEGYYRLFDGDERNLVALTDTHVVFAQSRKRFIVPGNDNFGFARWVQDNAEKLVEVLGEGRHFGEWWGYGIQSGYGVPKGARFFSLFNTSRWDSYELSLSGIPGLSAVPIIYAGPIRNMHYKNGDPIEASVQSLRDLGSMAAPGFMKPEGVVVYHTAANTTFKVTLEGDEKPKGPEGHKGDYGQE